MKIIYIHGFNSSGQSTKVDQLKQRFPTYNIVAPTLSADPEIAYKQIRDEIIHQQDETIIVGTSLGGFYSLIASIKFDIECFLINPSLKPYETLKTKVGVHTRYGTDNEVYDFKEEYLDKLKTLAQVISPENQEPNLINLYISKDDELLDFSNIDSLIPKRKTYKQFENAGHRFSKFHEIIEDMSFSTIQMQKSYSDVDFVL